MIPAVSAVAVVFELVAWKGAAKAARERGRKERAEERVKDREEVGEERRGAVVEVVVGESISFGNLESKF